MTYITQPTSGDIKLTDELALIRKETFICIIVGYKVNRQKKICGLYQYFNFSNKKKHALRNPDRNLSGSLLKKVFKTN